MQRKLLVFELNEVPYKVMDSFVARHPKSSFARLMDSAAQFVARTPDTVHLHPRISWPTFHRGVPDNVHGILEFNKDTSETDEKYPRYWELLRRKGKTIGIGASIGSYPLPSHLDNVAFYLPDTFAPTFEAFPDYLSVFQAFNNSAVSKSARVVATGVDMSKAVSLLVNARRVGLRPGSFMTVARQLASERLNKVRVVRRRTLQASLTFDVVFNQIVRTQPDLSTLFTNHVASSMHRYWAAAFPGDYLESGEGSGTVSRLQAKVTENKMSREWIETYKDEIDFCMSAGDHMMGKLLAFVDENPETRLLVMTTMGQTAARAVPRKNEVVLSDMKKFMARLELDQDEWTELPGMVPTYSVRFSSAAGYERFRQKMERLKISGKQVLVDANGKNTAAFAIRVVDVGEEDRIVTFGNEVGSFPEFGLSAANIQDGVGSSGWHIPEGAALLYDPKKDLSDVRDREVVDTTAFTAGILESFGVTPPGYMPAVPASLNRCFN